MSFRCLFGVFLFSITVILANGQRSSYSNGRGSNSGGNQPQQQPRTELGRACHLNRGRAECGQNAGCFPLTGGTIRSGLGVCWCLSKAYRQPASFPPAIQQPLIARMGANYWTDCVEILRIGDRCPNGSPINNNNNNNNNNGNNNGNIGNYGNYGNNNNNFGNYGNYGNSNNNGNTNSNPSNNNPSGTNNNNNNNFNYYYDYYGIEPRRKRRQANLPAAGAVMPDNAQCVNGRIQCNPGFVASGDAECVRQPRPGTVGYGQPCDSANCDASQGLACGSAVGGRVCTCSSGTWTGSSCSRTPSHGDSCRSDADCLSNAGNLLVPMACGGFSASGGTCNCPSRSGAAVLAAHAETNTDILLRGPGNRPVLAPARLNLNREQQLPFSSWCLNRNAVTVNTGDYLSICTLDLQQASASAVFRGCGNGLGCMYFPVSETDANVAGRCVPTSQNDPRWFGTEGATGDGNGNGQQFGNYADYGNSNRGSSSNNSSSSGGGSSSSNSNSNSTSNTSSNKSKSITSASPKVNVSPNLVGIAVFILAITLMMFN